MVPPSLDVPTYRSAGGTVASIHVAAVAGAIVNALSAVTVTAGEGLAADRYARREGYWSDRDVSRDMTLIETEVLEDIARERGLSLDPGETRRNIGTRGVRLDDLVGCMFWIGDVLCRGTGRCGPCHHLEAITGKRLIRALLHRGGLRADVLTTGTVRIGDPIRRVEEQAGVGVVAVRGRRVLVGRRRSQHGRGTWSTPGGKPEPDESAIACALRELEEETGLIATSAREVGESLDGFTESRLVFRTRFIEVEAPLGQPIAREPHKTSRWEWRDWDDLPGPLFTPVASLVSSGYRPPMRPHVAG